LTSSQSISAAEFDSFARRTDSDNPASVVGNQFQFTDDNGQPIDPYADPPVVTVINWD